MQISLIRAINLLENSRIPIWILVIEIAILGGVRFWIDGKVYHFTYTFAIFYQAITYYIFVFSFVLLITTVITKEKLLKISSAFFYAIPVILLPPLIDHYLFGRIFDYPYPHASTWMVITFTFFEKYVNVPSHGYQVEFGILLFLLSIYTYSKLRAIKMIKKISIAFVTTFIIYIMILVLSTPDFSPIVRYFNISSNSGVITYNFYYFILIFRYLFCVSVFFIIILIENNGIKRSVEILKSSYILLAILIIYIFGFLKGASMMSMENVVGRMNIISLGLGILAVFWAWLFIAELAYLSKNISSMSSYIIIKNLFPQKNIDSIHLSIFFAVMGTLAIIPDGSYPTYFYLLFLTFVTIYFFINPKSVFIRSVALGLSAGLVFALAYVSPQFTTFYDLDLNFTKYFLIILILVTFSVYIEFKYLKYKMLIYQKHN